MRKIEICRNDCIAYYDTIHLSGQFASKNSHRTKCPICDASRYVTDPKTGRVLPAKSMFHFQLKSYVRSLYNRPDLSAHLWHDCGDNPEGHVTRSRGFRQKVTENPHMASDNRNLALVGTTDGVPFFDDQIRGCWPFFFRCANLPDSLSTLPANIHLGLLSANEYYEVDKESGVLRRRIRGPKSLNPHLTVLVDDLLGAYRKGITVCDSTRAYSDPDYTFQCRVILLYWTGDYPALALVSGTHSKMCHWCRMVSVHSPEITRRCWCDYRRYLPSDHPWRRHGAFGAPETRPSPEPRNHPGYVADAVANINHRGYKKDRPYKTTGVKELSMLGALPYFDLVWDVLPDMMHIVSVIWKGHVFQMFVGKRTPAKPKNRVSWRGAKLDKEQHQDLHKHHYPQGARLDADHPIRRKIYP